MSSTKLYTIEQIAGWQVPSCAKKDAEKIALPSLQRGAVWKPIQVEALWDSLFRGFPVGSFLLSKYDEKRGLQTLKFQGNAPKNGEVDYHLLDGQQRANAVALGFQEAWSASDDPSAVLWLDLAPPANDDRLFMFRATTKSHPWGYREAFKSRSTARLTSAAIRDSLKTFRKCHPQLADMRAGNIPLGLTWPWESKAPVPLPLLLTAFRSGERLSSSIPSTLDAEIPWWRGNDVKTANGKLESGVTETLASAAGQRHLERIEAALTRLFGRKSEAVRYSVPALEVPTDEGAQIPSKKSSGDEDVAPPDPVVTLFQRINEGGTDLSADEMMYSLLKSSWPEAPDRITPLSVQFSDPARLVVLISQLVMADAKPWTEKFPADPDVPRFRRLIRGQDKDFKNFYKKLREFFDDGSAEKVLTTAHAFLVGTGRADDACAEYRLPAVLVAPIAQHAPSAMLLFLRWIHLLLKKDVNPLALEPAKVRRALGGLTALGWYTPGRTTESVSFLWPKLQATSADLPNFFSRKYFPAALSLTVHQQKRTLIPLPPPAKLERALKRQTFEAHGFNSPTGTTLWRNWYWEEYLSEVRVEDIALLPWYQETLSARWAPKGDLDEGTPNGILQDRYNAAWKRFIDQTHSKRDLVLFAQRKSLRSWFPNLDPSLPGQLDDMNRPYDFDHIHPQKYVDGKHNIRRMIKDWHSSIGNLRAWPLELNRADSDSTPARKMELDCAAGAQYGLSGEKAWKEASFIAADWQDWRSSTPDETNGFPERYLNLPDHGDCHKALVRAMVTRFAGLYRHWYETLLVGDLF